MARNPVPVDKATAGKTIALFRTLLERLRHPARPSICLAIWRAAEFRLRAWYEIWCAQRARRLRDGCLARDQKTEGKVRMLADGDAAFAKATGLTLDLTGKGLGLRSNRYSMLVRDGKVVTLNVEAPGKFEVSDAAHFACQAKALSVEQGVHDA